ncbi:MAG: acyl-CoA synthetase FdrA [Bradymonadales bacterium]
MILRSTVIENRYFDSVFLMSLAAELKKMGGVLDASALMGTDSNKDLLKDSGLLDDIAKSAAPNDLILSVKIENESQYPSIKERIDKFLAGEDDAAPKKRSGRGEQVAHTIEEGLDILEDANLLHISIPGPFVYNEALRAIDKGLNLFIFSDNVSIEEERIIKEEAKKRDLLVMGPDCGTAIINGVGLGFANVVPRGPLAVIGASGTGIQEITCLAAQRGIGIAQAIGLGGRDLRKEIGAISMLQALDMIETQSEVKVICLVSKPAHPDSMAKIMARAERMNLPIIACFLGASTEIAHPKNVHIATRLDEAVDMVEAVLRGETPKRSDKAIISETCLAKLQERKAKLPATRKNIKGLFSGGTLCDEALYMAKSLKLEKIQSNLVADSDPMAIINDGQNANLFLDMGDDKFTRGRPHPMIEFGYRMERVRAEAARAETAVILLDLVIGYGSHKDPLAALLPVIEEFNKDSDPVFVLSITGTAQDPQNLEQIKTQVKAAGAWIAKSNAQAAAMAIEFVKR